MEKYQTEFKALSDEEKGVLRVVLGEMKRIANYKDFSKVPLEKISYDKKNYNKDTNSEVYQKIKNFCTNIITPLVSFPLPSGEYAGKLMEVMAAEYRKNAKNRLKPGEYGQLSAAQQGALLSLAYNSPSLIGTNLRNYITHYLNATDETEKTKYRALAWAEIRYGSNGNRMQGLANRRYQEADYWGLTGENGTDAEIFADHQLTEIRNLDVEHKLMLKCAVEQGEMAYKKPSGGNYTIKQMGEEYEKKYPTTHLGTKYSFTMAELLIALEVSTVDVILAEIQAGDRKIDTVAEAFLRKYDGQTDYCIAPDKKGVIRSCVTQIIETWDVTVFNLMELLVLELKKRGEASRDEPVKQSVLELIKRSKTNLEAVIVAKNGYRKPSYLGDNSLFTPEEDGKRLQALITAFSERLPVSTPKSRKFFESFLSKEPVEEKKRSLPPQLRQEILVDQADGTAELAARLETDEEVLVRVGNGQFASPRLSRTITIKEAHQQGFIKSLDGYRKALG